MDQILTQFFTINFIFFCLGVAALTFIIRRVIEFIIIANPAVPATKNSKFWTEFFLPLFPILIGPIVNYFVKLSSAPFDKAGGRVFYGLVGGFLSGFVYRMVKSFLIKSSGPDSSPSFPPFPPMPTTATVVVPTGSPSVNISVNQDNNKDPQVGEIDPNLSKTP